jgi:glutamate N-acetyltransferase/amino-acid N-acetyltransferase
MRGPEVSLRVCLGHGPGSARVLGGDLSYDYVKINGEYTT